jgi:sensor histidine kinase YesM
MMQNKGLVVQKEKLKQRLFVLFWLTFLLSLSFELSTIYLQSGLLHYTIIVTGRIVCIAAIIYANLNFFIPKLLRKNKYFLFVLALFASAGLLYMVSALFNYLLNILGGKVQVFPSGRSYIFVIVFSTIRIAFIAYLLYVAMEWIDQKFSIQELELERRNAENRYLRNQLNPHFLFNTMNNLHGLILTNTKLASESILRFSDFLQYMVYESTEDLIPLEKEIQLIKDYVALERLRADKKKNLELTVEVEDLSYRIAPLLLLPLFENGVKHGLNVVEENAFLKMQITQTGNLLHVTVSNSKVKTTKGEQNGIGLKNLKKRLQLQYPQAHELIFSDEVEVFNASLKITLDEL